MESLHQSQLQGNRAWNVSDSREGCEGVRSGCSVLLPRVRSAELPLMPYSCLWVRRQDAAFDHSDYADHRTPDLIAYDRKYPAPDGRRRSDIPRVGSG